MFFQRCIDHLRYIRPASFEVEPGQLTQFGNRTGNCRLVSAGLARGLRGEKENVKGSIRFKQEGLPLNRFFELLKPDVQQILVRMLHFVMRQDNSGAV